MRGEDRSASALSSIHAGIAARSCWRARQLQGDPLPLSQLALFHSRGPARCERHAGDAQFRPGQIRIDAGQARRVVRVSVRQSGPRMREPREYLGDIDTFTASYEFEKMVTVRRKELTVRTNWKSYIENSLENFHLPTVHQGTIGGVKAQWNPIDGAPGNYVLLQSRTTASRATLGGDAAFERIATLARACRRRRAVHPDLSLQRDRSRPRLHVVQADGPRRARPHVQYRRRSASPSVAWNAPTSSRSSRLSQALRPRDQRGQRHRGGAVAGTLQSVRRPGRFSSLEPLVHTIDNWILDRVLEAAPAQKLSLRA